MDIKSLRYIAGHCVSTYRGDRVLAPEDMFDAALDALIAYVAEHGWPEDNAMPLFRAGANAIGRASHEAIKHIRHASAWTAPHGPRDAISEAVTDRIAVWQVAQLFSEKEWEAVWTLAHMLAAGGRQKDAAALLGIGPGLMSQRLEGARAKARAAWIAPDETPRRQFRGSHDGKPSKATVAMNNRKRKEVYD